jgi:prophage antirepressor-like protein
MSNIAVIKEIEVLGRMFKVYGTVEEPLFLAKDIAELIEHSNVSEMVSTVDEDEKATITISYTSSMTTNQLFLTEYGFYEVLMQSRKPTTKAFKKEIKKILKALRLYYK